MWKITIFRQLLCYVCYATGLENNLLTISEEHKVFKLSSCKLCLSYLSEFKVVKIHVVEANILKYVGSPQKLCG